MLTRIRPETLRWFMCSVNLLLLAMLAWCMLFVFSYNKLIGVALNDESWYRPVKGFKLLSEADIQRYGIREAAAPGPLHDRPACVAAILDPLLPPPVPSPPRQQQPQQPFEGGPLDDKWVVETWLKCPGEAQVYVVLSEKAPEATTGGRGPATGPYPNAVRANAKVRFGKQKLLRIYDAKLNPRPIRIGGRAFFLIAVDFAQDTIVYTEANPEGVLDPEAGRYTLKKAAKVSHEGIGPSDDPLRRTPQIDPDERGAIHVGGSVL